MPPLHPVPPLPIILSGLGGHTPPTHLHRAQSIRDLFKGGYRFLVSWWNLLDLVNNSLFVTVIGLRAYVLLLLVDQVRNPSTPGM